MSVPSIHFTQEQARTLAGVSAGDIRHWRRVVPYLAAKPGKSARFTFADLVALTVTRELVTTFGVHISAVGRSVDGLFRLLADVRSAHLEGTFVLVGTDRAWLLREPELSDRCLDGPVVVVPCDPLIGRIREQILPVTRGDEQASLPFPPQMIRSGA